MMCFFRKDSNGEIHDLKKQLRVKDKEVKKLRRAFDEVVMIVDRIRNKQKESLMDRECCEKLRSAVDKGNDQEIVQIIRDYIGQRG